MSTATPTDWKTGPAPRTAREWIARAGEVAAVLATDAAERERAGATPYDEVRLLKDSGLVTKEDPWPPFCPLPAAPPSPPAPRSSSATWTPV
ncbi:hypothetical protein [Streptomyces caniscabiei]|uniref:hypothetical protein n=1 Tax=Streptomyces caniscabiei TaxID=2746961 RepID=UPI0029ADD3BD|nr:hypothetical protein [Streptomyces caniscabiei]